MLFSDLPTEIIQQVLFNLPPESFAATCQTSKALNTIADTPLLWRYYCQTEYRYWDPRNGSMKIKMVSPVEDVPWKNLFTMKRLQDRRIDGLLDRMINRDISRIELMEEILKTDSWDAKDALLRHINCSEDKEDYLARTFWARATLDRLHRSRALHIWTNLRYLADHETETLERSLAAYDMFTDGLEDVFCGDVKDHLDKLAVSFKEMHSDYQELGIRTKALTLASFLRAHDFRGVAQDDEYHNLPNNFIIRALNDPNHPALPLVCVAIYCALATRIGLNAKPCGFPMHVYAIVEQDGDRNLDGGPLSDSAERERMYIDPFREEVEVPSSHLTSQLNSMGASGVASESLLGPASTTEITLRTSRNIMHSVRMAQTRPHDDQGGRVETEGWPDTDVSLYASLWVSVLLQEAGGASNHQAQHRMRHYLPFLCEQFQSYYPWDASLFEENILPLLRGLPEYNHMVEILNVVRAADRNQKPIVRREGTAKDRVKHKIGQHFKHERYGYRGVIIGWDVDCDATEEWMTQMRIHELGRGRHQSFYHVLAEDKSKRYVAEDNIQPTTETPRPALMRLAGRYFRRWDKETGIFVSNIREEYPDD